jgi:tricorn protease
MLVPGEARGAVSSRPTRLILLAALACLLSPPATAAAGGPLLRFPDVHGDSLVFVHGEDIWTAPASGGLARRLTDDDGEERHPKFSPDGSLIAFSAELDGNRDVYVMDAVGGNIRRLTYHPVADEVVGWHPTKEKVLFRSSRSSFSRFDRLFLIAPDGSGLEELPLHEAARGSFSPDGKRLAYNRIAREDRTWKRYRGGLAQDLWLYDFETQEDRRLTEHRGTDRLPMWIGGTIYFASDRDRVLNLYAYDPESGAIEAVTEHRDYDIRRPSHGGPMIVYELAGDLWLLDTRSGETRRVPIEIPVDPRETRPYRKNVSEFITGVGASPEGGRALVEARGELFTVPKEHGATRNLTRTPGARDRYAAWSPDGERIAFLSDRGGEYDIHLVDALGESEPERLTDLGPGYRHTLRWSPDGKRIAFADQTLALFILDVASREVIFVDRSEVEPVDIGLEEKPISDFTWSPDGRWLAYSKIDLNHLSGIYLHSIEEGKARRVSGDLFNDFGPAFASDGRHLFFVSNRRFDPTLGDFEWEMVYKKVAGIYALSLTADAGPALPVLSDESAPAEKNGDEERGEDRRATPTVRVDFEGIAGRAQALPLPRGNYRALAAARGVLYYLNDEEGDYNRFEYRSPGPKDLMSFDLEDREEKTLLEDIDGYALSADGTHVAFRRGGSVGLRKVKETGWRAHFEKAEGRGEKGGNGTLDLSGLTMVIDPPAEWRQVFEEAWRMERDFFYDPNMHGLDWPALGEKYRPLVERATCAQDLRFIIGELIGELATSHTYVGAGDRRRRAEPVNVGLLGADWEADPGAGLYRIAKIYRVPHWTREVWPPLAGPGIAVSEGDYLLAVNGEPVSTEREVFAAFQGLAGTQVRLTLNDRPTARGAREVTVEPLSSERTLRYLDWVEHNRRVVSEASGGRIGYLHLPDTYMGSAVEFPAYFYGQTRKEGLIVDGRFNAGGLDPDIFLQRLAKRPLSFWTRRYSEDQVSPLYANRAHMVCLTNRQAGSGGDDLPYEFRRKGMGPIVGTRTWGGLVGISMGLRMMDGSRLTAPDYRIYTPEGDWVVENEGVTPDIEVENDPAEMLRGHNAQLRRAIDHLLEKIEADPLPEITHPPFPTET